MTKRVSLLFVSGHGNGTDFSLWWDSVKHHLKGHHVYLSLELAKVIKIELKLLIHKL